MANSMINLSSAGAPSVVISDKSGQPAAQLLSGAATSSTLLGEAAVTPLAEDGSRITAEKGELDTTGSRLAQQLEEQAQKLQEMSQLKGWAVSFSVDSELNKTVIRVVDADTQKTIRQIPSEELLTLSKRIRDLQDGDDSKMALAGMLFDGKI